MSIDIKELKRLARKVAECEDRPEIADEHAEAADALWLHMHCHTILGLIEEIERRDENPNFRAVQSARQEAEKLKAENEWLQKARIPAGFYRELLALRELRDKAKAYVEGYLQDEIEDIDACVSEGQHIAALELCGRLKDAFESYWDAAMTQERGQ
ncbi:hypothetical protein [Pseudomonas sp. SWI44]|uniref:hypothetical protein n=1 Tax=Pseudomonas sp. SWI44 TaxID=2083053 RepID=UPI000CE5E679|nr:hypothetical protein [Pseudomonas sp. SWI44]AVD85985.1 hypothetical protein C4Q26_01955 [Pseudomonas sp. SWI44]